MTWAIFRDAHVQAIVEMLQQGTNARVTAVVGGALLDETLRRTLAERLQDDADIANKLLKVGGAIGNTGPKIDLLYMLGAVDRQTRNALYGLSQIRNFFAHNLEASFESSEREFSDAVKMLTLHEGRATYPHHFMPGDTTIELEAVKNNRDKFVINLKLCLIALMRDRVSHLPWSNTPRTADGIKTEWEKLKKEADEKSLPGETLEPLLGELLSPKTPR